MVWTNTMGKGAYRGPVDVRDHGPRDGHRPRRARRSASTRSSCAAGTCCRRPSCRSPRPGGKVFKEITPLETLEQALEMLDYDAFRAEQAAARAEGRLLGLGCCVYVEPTSMDAPTLATEGATVRVEASGKVVAYLGTTSHGQSVETTMAQIVADTLGVDYDDVTVVQGDTAVDALRPGHRRQPHGGRRRRRGPRRPPTRSARRSLAVAAHTMEADAGRPRRSTTARCSCGARRRGR